MMNRPLGAKVRTWLFGTALLALGGALRTAALPSGEPPGTDEAIATRAGPHGAAHVGSLPSAFPEAADQVLPSVVMIRNTPTLAARSPDRGPLPDKGLHRTPSGDLDHHSEFRRFLRNMPFGDLHRMQFVVLRTRPEDAIHGECRQPGARRQRA